MTTETHSALVRAALAIREHARPRAGHVGGPVETFTVDREHYIALCNALRTLPVEFDIDELSVIRSALNVADGEYIRSLAELEAAPDYFQETSASFRLAKSYRLRRAALMSAKAKAVRLWNIALGARFPVSGSDTPTRAG